MNNGSESFQKQTEIVLSAYKGAKNIRDDAITWGMLLDERNNLDEALTRIEEHGLKINSRKCILGATSLIFSNYKSSAYRRSPDEKNVFDICIFGPQTSSAEVFKWTSEHQNAFDQLKTMLINFNVLAYYNPAASNTESIVDASSYGLGAILAQEKTDRHYKPVQYPSHSLDYTQTRYRQTERETFATIWACEHLHSCIYNKHFTIETDYKPLEKLLSTKLTPPLHIERCMIYG